MTIPFAGRAQEEIQPSTERSTVEPGSYLYYELDGRWATQYDFLIRASSPVDVFLVSYAQFQNYKSGRTVDSEFRAVSETEFRQTFQLPTRETYFVLIDNTIFPDGGAPGNRLAHVDSGFIRLTPVGELAGFDDFLRTLFLRQDYWEIPWVTGVGIAGPTLIFLLISIPTALMAQDGSATWWIALGVMVVLGGALTLVTVDGFVFDTRILSLPAAALGFWTFRRTSSTLTAAASVFSAAFLGGFLGVDVLNEIMHHEEHVQRYTYEGIIGVFGGAGWGDGLVVAPMVGLVTFGIFRASTRHTRLMVAAELDGDTVDGTLYLKVYNAGEHLAKDVHLRVVLDGDAVPAAVIEDGRLSEFLESGYEMGHSIESPQSRAPGNAPWTRIIVTVRAGNATEQSAVIQLVRA